MSLFRRASLSLVMTLGLMTCSHAQESERVPNDRLASVEASLRRLEKEVGALRRFLRATLPSPMQEIAPFQLKLDVAASKGSDAKIVVIEFSDFQCPFCGQHARNVYPEIMRELVDTGQIRYVFRNLPLESVHPNALKAAEAAACAGQQGKFWEMHDRLFAHQQMLSIADLQDHAKAIELNQSAFTTCLSDEKTAARIREDVSDAVKLGVTGTPTFLIGEWTPAGARISRRISGTQSLAVFRVAIDSLLDQ